MTYNMYLDMFAACPLPVGITTYSSIKSTAGINLEGGATM